MGLASLMVAVTPGPTQIGLWDTILLYASRLLLGV